MPNKPTTNKRTRLSTRDENRLGAVVALIEASACMIEAGAAHPVKEATDAQ